ncbi:MAG TPA: DUF732 domain-containing protein [Mycobacterium sp.]|nr:DUF732 domain-containing protein [Mycobacterium sp.]
MWVDVISAAAMVLRPLVVSLSIITAAATWSPPGHADPADDSITNALNEAGIGNNGSVSTAIAEIGQKICPMLVRPGATLASAASEVAGHTGLSPAIAGFVTSMAIQMECPGVMTSLADGNVPFPLQLPSADSAPPGANPVPPMPFALPGPSPTPTNAAQLPVL